MQTDHKWTFLLEGASLPDQALIGGKAWSLARMRVLGLPVPPAFVITTRACLAYLQKQTLPDGLQAEIDAGIAWLEQQTGRRFGADASPLLLSVRSGAAISMPGMMDTVLNLGIDETTEKALARESGDAAFARDTHRRFYQLYSQIVLKATPPELSQDASPAQWRERVDAVAAQSMPTNIKEQLLAAICAVFDSWNTRRARRYRKHNHIADDLGTAVTIQAMVYGNMDARSGTGVLFSRNPLTGEPVAYGEYLPRAQGEDVVSGKRTPQPLAAMQTSEPEAHAQLLDTAALLERENGDVQDIEFTLQQGQLYLLQSRSAKRAPAAAVRIAVDMQQAGQLSEREALLRVTASQARSLLRPRLAAGAAEPAKQLARGQGACPGVASGVVVTDPDEAEQQAKNGQPVILARATTSPEDVHGMLAAAAVITEQGGTTSHAAVVSRALGRPCVVGCGADSVTRLAGQSVTVDGDSGAIYAGALKMVIPDEREEPRLQTLLDLAEKYSPLKVFRPDAAPQAEVLDMDKSRVRSTEQPENLATLLAGQTAAKGGAIASDEGVAAALDAGLSFIICEPVLPPQLAAIHAQDKSREH